LLELPQFATGCRHALTVARTRVSAHSKSVERRSPRRFLLFGLFLGAGLASGISVLAAELTKAIEIRSLSYDQAEAGIEVTVRGTVTFIEGPGAVFVQDETAGTFFRPEQMDKLSPGDIVEVTGRTQPGNYLPGIALAPYRILGHGPLPAAVTVGYDDLASGRYHYQRVAIEGIARSVTPVGEGRSVLRLDVGSRIVEAWVDAGIEDESAIVDSRVRVEGLAAGGINRRRQLVQPYLRTRDSSEITILKPAVPESEIPRVTAADLLTFQLAAQGNHRVRINGVVTACISRILVFVRGDQNAFGLRFSAPTSVEVGDRIDVLGFTEMGRFSASVVDARLLSREPGPAPVPMEVDLDSLMTGARDGDLVAVNATVADFFRTDAGVVLALQRDGRSLQARGPAMSLAPPLGSLVRVVGICQVESSTSVVLSSRPETVALQIRSPEDITVLQSPSRWTVRRLLGILAFLAAITVISMLWVAALRRQVRRQTEALRRRIESEAALEERQRIAREFHDSLEQDLTGLGLRLDAAATRALDDKGREIIAVSRSLLSRIQAETKNFVSDLRDSAELDGDLATALEAIAASQGGAIDVRVEFTAAPPALPGGSIHHLRMIARESVTNVLKHAHATQAVIHVSVSDGLLVLRITDDGNGFDVSARTLGKSGHFGCVGIRERARKLGGRVNWRSGPGGTTVEVSLPVSPTRSVSPGTRIDPAETSAEPARAI